VFINVRVGRLLAKRLVVVNFALMDSAAVVISDAVVRAGSLDAAFFFGGGWSGLSYN
jgi:hypothetical protein